MANVELKTDFKDGEKLYGPELNNNFKAIKAALEAMNKIVWQDDQEIPDSITAFRGTTEELMNREIIDGQLLYDTNTGETYIDYEGRRISTGSGNAIHIGDTEPTNPSTQIWIPTDEFTSVGTEVVNSLEGNQERMAPSVAAVNNALSTIIESGSNDNGNYVKFSDGTIICYGFTNGISFTSAEFKDGVIDISSFGLKFIQNAQLTLMSNYSNYENGKFQLHMKDVSTSNITYSIRNEYSSSINFYVSWFAIGKWK